jgi:hypothetical protein
MARLRSVLTRAGLLAKPRDVLVTGLPRSGTTLTCHLLQKLPDTVALHEPMASRKFSSERTADEMCGDVERFLRKQRKSIAERGMAMSKHAEGKVPDNPVGTQRNEQGKRTNEGMDRGEIVIDKELPRDFMLVVKHNSSFTGLLHLLVERFDVFAVMRNPFGVLGSWNSISLEVGRGHVPAAERIDAKLAKDLAAIEDVVDRQLRILDWFYGRYRDLLPAERVIRYEDVIATRGKRLAIINPLASSLDEPLESRNRNKLYDADAMNSIGRRLLASDGAYWHFYTRESVETLLRG